MNSQLAVPPPSDPTPSATAAHPTPPNGTTMDPLRSGAIFRIRNPQLLKSPFPRHLQTTAAIERPPSTAVDEGSHAVPPTQPALRRPKPLYAAAFVAPLSLTGHSIPATATMPPPPSPNLRGHRPSPSASNVTASSALSSLLPSSSAIASQCLQPDSSDSPAAIAAPQPLHADNQAHTHEAGTSDRFQTSMQTLAATPGHTAVLKSILASGTIPKSSPMPIHVSRRSAVNSTTPAATVSVGGHSALARDGQGTALDVDSSIDCLVQRLESTDWANQAWNEEHDLAFVNGAMEEECSEVRSVLSQLSASRRTAAVAATPNALDVPETDDLGQTGKALPDPSLDDDKWDEDAVVEERPPRPLHVLEQSSASDASKRGRRAAPSTDKRSSKADEQKRSRNRPSSTAPSPSVTTGSRTGSPGETGLDPSAPEVHFAGWWLKTADRDSIRKDKIIPVAIEGYKLDGGQMWHSSCIVKRVQPRILKTASGNTYYLHGELDRAVMSAKGFSGQFIDYFSHGFPGDWIRLLSPNSGNTVQEHSAKSSETVKKSAALYDKPKSRAKTQAPVKTRAPPDELSRQVDSIEESCAAATLPLVKRGRGRPRKNPESVRVTADQPPKQLPIQAATFQKDNATPKDMAEAKKSLFRYDTLETNYMEITVQNEVQNQDDLGTSEPLQQRKKENVPDQMNEKPYNPVQNEAFPNVPTEDSRMEKALSPSAPKRDADVPLEGPSAQDNDREMDEVNGSAVIKQARKQKSAPQEKSLPVLFPVDITPSTTRTTRRSSCGTGTIKFEWGTGRIRVLDLGDEKVQPSRPPVNLPSPDSVQDEPLASEINEAVPKPSAIVAPRKRGRPRKSDTLSVAGLHVLKKALETPKHSAGDNHSPPSASLGRDGLRLVKANQRNVSRPEEAEFLSKDRSLASSDELAVSEANLRPSSKRRDGSEPSIVAMSWTALEDRILQKAVFTFNPQDPDYWKKVAREIPGKSRSECQQRYQSNYGRLDWTTRLKNLDKAKARPLSQTVQQVEGAPVKLARKGTLARKRQIRQLLQQRRIHQDHDEGDSALEDGPERDSEMYRHGKKPKWDRGTPEQGNRGHIDDPGDDRDDDDGSDPNARTTILRPYDVDEKDRYVAHLQRRIRKGTADPQSKRSTRPPQPASRRQPKTPVGVARQVKRMVASVLERKRPHRTADLSAEANAGEQEEDDDDSDVDALDHEEGEQELLTADTVPALDYFG